MSKIAVEEVALAVITMIMVGNLVVFGTQRVLNLDERIAVRTVDMPAARVGSSVYMMDGLEEGELEMDFGRNYSIVRENGDPYLEYEMKEVLISTGKTSGKNEIIPPESVTFRAIEGESRNFCIVKTPQELVLKPESC